jgi:hypothetical protein
MDEVQRQGFEIGGGWYAKRGSDGSVSIYVPEPGERTFTPQQWASLVASVSHHGEGDLSYRSALNFHVGSE